MQQIRRFLLQNRRNRFRAEPVPTAKYLNFGGPGHVGTALAFNTLPKRSVTALGIDNGLHTGSRRQKKNIYKNNKIEIQ